MINSIRKAIASKLLELYPTYPIHKNDVPQNFKPPCFIVYIIDQNYDKRINTKYKSMISFDVAYFSDKPTTTIKDDCLDKQQVLLRAFDLIGTFRVLNKQCSITDNVLHFTFDINYSELLEETDSLMQNATTITIERR